MRPSAILWTQGHLLQLDESAAPVLTAIADFAAEHALPVCYFGSPLEQISPRAAVLLKEVVSAGRMPLNRYHALLERLPTMLAVAPLETAGDATTLEFIAGKSDVKMVEYGGFGHPGVYSDAPPYRDTDLKCGSVVANTYEAWSHALREVWDGGWRRAREEGEAVRGRRTIDTVASTSWVRAVSEARLEQPVDVRELLNISDRLRARSADLRARAAWHVRH